MFNLVYGVNFIFSMTIKRRVKIKPWVTMVIRYAWYVFKSSLVIQAQISLSFNLHLDSNWNNADDIWVDFW